MLTASVDSTTPSIHQLRIDSTRLQQQLAFIIEIDQLKSVLRRTRLVNGERRENSAEHSWHLALMAMILAEHANEQIDLVRVTKMVLIHDIVEVDAGDTYSYDEIGALDKAEREQRAADRIFGLLPADQEADLWALWDEFEARATPESRFANALDRLMPMLHNYLNRGGNWQEYSITQSQVRTRNGPIQEGSQALWQIAAQIIEQGLAQGYLREG